MSTTFGGTIKLDGEKEYREALSQISKELKVAGSEMKIVTAEFGKNNNSVEALTAKNKVLSAEIEKQEEKVGLLNGAYKESVEKYGENSKQALNYKQQLNNATAQLITMTKEVEENEKAIKEAGDTSTSAAKDVDKLGDELKSAGKEADDGSEKLEKFKNAAKVAGGALATAFTAAGAGIVKATKELTNATVEASAYADEMLTMSTVTGVSTEKLQAYNYAAELVDVSLETVTKTMAKNVKSMSSAADGSKAYAEAYKRLKVEVTDANGKLRDSETVYWEIIDALKGVKNETERDAIAMQLFGKSAQELNPLIQQGSEGIKKLTDEAKKMGAVMSDKQLQELGGFDDSIQRLKSGASAAKNALGTVLLPQLSALATDGVDLLGKFNRGLVAADGDWGKIGKTFGSALSGMMSKLTDFTPSFSDAIVGMISSVVSGISNHQDSIISAANSIVTSLVTGVSVMLPELIPVATSLILTVVSGLLNNLPLLVEAALQVVISLSTGITDSLPELIPTIVETMLTIVNVLLDNIDLLIEAAIQIVVALAEGIIGALPELIARLTEIIIKIQSTLIQLAPQLISASIRIIAVLAEGLIKAIPDLVSKIPQIIRGIKNALSQGAADMKSIGANFLKGIWQGIVDTTSWLYNKVKSIGSVIIGAMEDGLDIHSPSRKARDRVGKMTAKGVGVGYVDELKNVKTLIKDATQKVLPENLDMGVNTSVHTSVTNYAAQAIASAVINALRQFKGQVILSDREVGEFVIDTVTREVFA